MVFLAPPLLLLEQSTSSWPGINALPCKMTTSDERQALRVNLLSGAPVVQATPDRSEKTEALGGKSPARLYRRPQSQDMPFCGPWASSQLGHTIAGKQKMPWLTTKAWLLPEVGWHQLLPTADQDFEGGGINLPREAG